MPQYRPFNDGINDEKLRSRLRKEAWGSIVHKKPQARWTSKLCSVCRKWNDREDPGNWCEHFNAAYSDTDTDGSRLPSVQVFKPYFNPNAQPGGVWLETRQKEAECMRLNGKEWNH